MKTIAMLTQAEENELVARATQGDRDAMAQLLAAHEPLFRGVARRWKRNDDEDFMSVMHLTFMENLPKFDPSLGYRINTYLRWHLIEAGHQYVRRRRSLIVVSEIQSNRLLRQLSHEMHRQEMKHGKPMTGPEIEELCARHGVERRALEHYNKLHEGAVPLDAMKESDEFLVLPANQDEECYLQQQRQMVSDAIKELSEREQRIIMTRHYTQDDVLTLEDLGQEFNVSRERIRQIEVRALEKLKASMARRLSSPIAKVLNDNTKPAKAA